MTIFSLSRWLPGRKIIPEHTLEERDVYGLPGQTQYAKKNVRPIVISFPVIYVLLDSLFNWVFTVQALNSFHPPSAWLITQNISLPEYIVMHNVLPALFVIAAFGVWHGYQRSASWLANLLFLKLMLTIWELLFNPLLVLQSSLITETVPQLLLSMTALILLLTPASLRWLGITKSRQTLLMRFTFWTGFLLSVILSLIFEWLV